MLSSRFRYRTGCYKLVTPWHSSGSAERASIGPVPWLGAIFAPDDVLVIHACSVHTLSELSIEIMTRKKHGLVECTVFGNKSFTVQGFLYRHYLDSIQFTSCAHSRLLSQY